MAAEEEFRVKFTGDAGELAKTTQDLTSQLKRFEEGLKRAAQGSDSFNRIQRAIDATKSRIDLLNKVDSFQNLKKGGDQATQSLINLSRVAQDAPYGFIGIANNLNPLLESFQRLKTETGGTKAAFSALVSGLTGPAGIGLALGVVSSLLVTFGDQLFKSKGGIDENAVALEKFKVAADEASKGVDDLKESFDRINRFAKLNVELSFGKGGKADLLDLQAQSIQQRGIVKKAAEDYARLGDSMNQAQENFKSKLSSGGLELFDKGLIGAFEEQMNEDTKKAYTVYKGILKQYEDAGKKLSDEDAKQKELYALQKLKRRDIEEEDLKKTEEANKKAESEAKRHAAEMEKLRQEERDRINRHESGRWREEIDSPIQPGKIPIPAPSKSMTEAVELRVPVIIVPEGAEVDIDKVNKALDQMLQQQKFEKRLEQLQSSIKSFSDYTADVLGKAFADVFEAIIDGEDPLKAFLNSLKQTVKQVASELIATYIRVAIFKALASPATGGGATGAAGLLKFLGFAKGGIVPGTGNSDSVPAMLTPGELVVPKNLAPAIASMLGYGSQALNRSLPQARNGGSQYAGEGAINVHLSGEFRQSGQDLVYTINQVHKSQRRAF